MFRGTIKGLLFCVVLALAACSKPALIPTPSPTPTLEPAPLSIYFASKDTPNQDTPPPLQYRLVALNASDSSLRWSDQGSSTEMHSILDHGVVYSGDAGITAVSALTGKVLWHFQSGDAAQVKAVNSNTVFCTETISGTNQDRLFALDASTGRLLWRSDARFEKPVIQISNKIIYLVNFGMSSTNPAYGLMAYDALTGKQLWRFATGIGNVIFEFQVSGDKIYAQVTGETLLSYLAVLNARDGSVLWRFPQAPQVSIEAQGIGSGLVYVRSWNDESLYALNIGDGSVKWQVHLGLAASYVLTDDTLYVSTSKGTIYALNPRDGTIQWQVQAGQPKTDFDTRVALVRQGLLYVTRSNDGIYALHTRDGSVAWSSSTGTFPAQTDFSVLDASNGVLYVEALDATKAAGPGLYAFNTSNGTQRWLYHIQDNTVSGMTLG